MSGIGIGITIIVIILVMTFSQVVMLSVSQKKRHQEILDLLQNTRGQSS
jgi:preprotein translocase subunit YajC